MKIFPFPFSLLKFKKYYKIKDMKTEILYSMHTVQYKSKVHVCSYNKNQSPTFLFWDIVFFVRFNSYYSIQVIMTVYT